MPVSQKHIAVTSLHCSKRQIGNHLSAFLPSLYFSSSKASCVEMSFEKVNFSRPFQTQMGMDKGYVTKTLKFF